MKSIMILICMVLGAVLWVISIAGCQDEGDSDPGPVMKECEQGLDPCADGCIGADGVCSPEDGWLRHDIGQQDDALYVYAADMDGDGDQDMLVTSSDHNPGYASEVAWYRNEGAGASWTKIVVSSADDADPVQATNGITAQDFDQDGIMDIAVAAGPTPNEGHSGVYLFKGPADPGGGWVRTDLFEDDKKVFFKIYPADINGDGYDDVVAGGRDEGLIAVNPGDSGGDWTIELMNPQTGGGLHVADMDGDGTPEVIGANAFAGKVMVTKVTVSEESFTYVDTLVGDLAMVLDVNVLDINEDGHPDILASKIGGPGFRWFENPGDGSDNWPEHMIDDNFSCSDIFVGDINGDGQDDVIVSGLAMMQADSPPASFAWFEYELSKGNVDWVMHYVDYDKSDLTIPGDVTLTDINGDGKLDVASTSVFDNTVMWYANDLFL
ncbi:MAG: VCBS repeat-containing protein [Proteobacteria bacterium]|nr:VCBS repeat-containing protein [Pseudomonadota bacterium]